MSPNLSKIYIQMFQASSRPVTRVTSLCAVSSRVILGQPTGCYIISQPMYVHQRLAMDFEPEDFSVESTYESAKSNTTFLSSELAITLPSGVSFKNFRAPTKALPLLPPINSPSFLMIRFAPANDSVSAVLTQWSIAAW